MGNKKAVVWVSTVLYILISLAILSVVLVSVQPIINKNRDKAVLYQSETMLNEIDSTIIKVSDNEGTILNLDVKISQGNLIINSTNNVIAFELKDSGYQYGEENKTIKTGKIYSLTRKINGKWGVLMYLNYSNYNITYTSLESNKILSEGNYVLAFENKNSISKQIDVRAS
jgi:hypothetical protein